MKKNIALKLGATSLLLALCLGLSGCASLTKEDLTPAGVTVLNKHSEIVLVNVTPNEKFDPMDSADKQAVQDAIVASINQAALFSQVLTNGNGDYQLDVRLLDGRQTPENPGSDTSWRDPSTPYTCFIHTVWELTRTQDHKLVYKDDITTVGHEVGVWHGIVCVLDWRGAIGRTIGTNIQLAIERMGNVKEFGELQVQSLDQSQPNPTVANTGGAQTLGTTPASNPGGSNYTLKTDPAAEAAFPDVARKYRETPVKPELSEEAHKYAVQGDFAIENKNLPVAIDRYTDALKIAPWWPEGYLKRGQLLAEIGQDDAAVADMKKFLLLAPDAKEAREAQDNIYKWESAGTLAVPKSTTPGVGESAFAGHLSGQYSGLTHAMLPFPKHGTFDFVIHGDGTVAATSDKASLSGNVDTSGHITVSASTDPGMSFTGQLTQSGNTLSGNGTWKMAAKAGFMHPASTLASGDWSGSGEGTLPTTPATTGSTPVPNLAPGQTVSANKAVVYIYRPAPASSFHSSEMKVPFPVEANGKQVTTLVQGGYYAYWTEPGQIVFTAFDTGFMAPKDVCSVTIDAKTGQAYYLKGSHHNGAIGRATLTLVAPEVGASEITSCKLIP
jgi:tetratricopeptide (TPR) repeat protein